MTRVRKKIGTIPPASVQQKIDDAIIQMQTDVSNFIEDETAQYPEIGGAFKFQEDPEERSEITTDSEGKIISYRDSDGKKHEEVGFVSPKITTDSLNLSESGMTEFQQALKDSGFQPGGGGDWSDREVIELPEPKQYALLNINIDSLPINSGDVREASILYYDGLGNSFKMSAEIEIQGQTSRIFAQTGGKGNYTLDLPKDVKFGSWVPQDSFHLKGAAKDVTRGILPISYKLAYKLMESLNAKPNRALSEGNNTNYEYASGDRFTDWGDNARCIPDGFPVEVYVNGNYHGLYSWQLKKHRKNYSMNKKDYTSFFLDAEAMMSNDYLHGIWNDGPAAWWTSFEIKNPKDLVCMDGSAYDGDHPKELIDSTSEYYDSNNKAHVGSAKTKSIIESFSTKYLEVKSLITNNDIVQAKEKFNEYFDYNACMLVYIFNCVMRNYDSVKKNTLWGIWKNNKIAPMLYDLDAMYGEGWTGTISYGIGAQMWSDTYATAEWPLSLFWSLYESEVRSTYSELRRSGLISIDTWKDVMYGWVNRIGVEAYNRDIEKWPETPSYRKNLTDTTYWAEVPTGGATVEWDESTQYNQGDKVFLRLYPNSAYTQSYRAVQANTGKCPVTSFYEHFPRVGGYYNSPKRMEKWVIEQLRLTDIAMRYSE